MKGCEEIITVVFVCLYGEYIVLNGSFFSQKYYLFFVKNFFTGIFFTLRFNALLSQVADDFETEILSIVGGVISSVVGGGLV